MEEYIFMNYIDVESGDDDEEEQAQRKADNPFAESNSKFKKNYRLSKSLTRALVQELRPYLEEGRRTNDLTVETKAHTKTLLQIIKMHVWSNRLYQKVEVVAAINNPAVFHKWVKYPSTFQEMNNNPRTFYHFYGLPGCVGCIDCTHVAIHPPPVESYDEKSYVNRKGYHSINTQLICDADLRILNVNALYPGSSHDSFICNLSSVLPLMQNINLRGKYYLIGDSGYALRPWLHTPI
ncbi:hypothetical protein O0L34_g3673 [Tuta absoluta]|nr:hypothetical protein O0L34_g3673 [Tuta absoluta]